MLQVFSFESKEVRFVGTAENPAWIGKDTCAALSISKYRDAIADLDEDERVWVYVDTLGGKQKMVAINLKGMKRLLSKSRKLNALRFAQAMGIEVFTSCKEQDTLIVLSDSFSHLNPIHQYPVNKYYLDLYLSSVNIAIECDERNHESYSHTSEAERERFITELLGCAFVRFNPDAPDFSIGKIINKVIRLVYENPEQGVFGEGRLI